MEDVLDVYERPYDPLCPVVYMDETNRQLIEQRSLPMEPGQPERVDYEYRRHGVVDLFVAFEPLACKKRVVKVTESRTAVDFAHFLRELVDHHYSHCEKIVLVMDNLNIHSTASLYKAFEPAEAHRIAARLEIHNTPVHASWLNMAEIEIGVLSRQCLSQQMISFYRIPTYRMSREEVKTVIFRYIFGYYNTIRVNSFDLHGLPPVKLRVEPWLLKIWGVFRLYLYLQFVRWSAYV